MQQTTAEIKLREVSNTTTCEEMLARAQAELGSVYIKALASTENKEHRLFARHTIYQPGKRVVLLWSSLKHGSKYKKTLSIALHRWDTANVCMRRYMTIDYAHPKYTLKQEEDKEAYFWFLAECALVHGHLDN